MLGSSCTYDRQCVPWLHLPVLPTYASATALVEATFESVGRQPRRTLDPHALRSLFSRLRFFEVVTALVVHLVESFLASTHAHLSMRATVHLPRSGSWSGVVAMAGLEPATSGI